MVARVIHTVAGSLHHHATTLQHHAALKAAAFLSPPFRVGHANAIPRQSPPETRYARQRLLEDLDHLDNQINGFEERMAGMLRHTCGLELVETLPGVGVILGLADGRL